MACLKVFKDFLNWDEEIEIFKRDGFGLNCIIFYNDGTIGYRRNCTEFHHRFDEGNRNASAFESDIHSTGGVVELDKVNRIEVGIAKFMYKDHRD